MDVTRVLCRWPYVTLLTIISPWERASTCWFVKTVGGCEQISCIEGWLSQCAVRPVACAKSLFRAFVNGCHKRLIEEDAVELDVGRDFVPFDGANAPRSYGCTYKPRTAFCDVSSEWPVSNEKW